MSLIVGIPMYGVHRHTETCLASVIDNITESDTFVVLVDNSPGAKLWSYGPAENCAMYIPDRNIGYYRSLDAMVQLSRSEHDIVAILQDDILIYQKGWDRLVKRAFDENDVDVLGFTGSDAIDPNGGYFDRLRCSYRGQFGPSQEVSGKRLVGFIHAALIGGQFIACRVSSLPLLGPIDDMIQPLYFIERSWSARVIDAQGKLGVVGVEIDHIEGMTSSVQPTWLDDVGAEWLKKVCAYDRGELDAEQYVLTKTPTYKLYNIGVTPDTYPALCDRLKELVGGIGTRLQLEAEQRYLQELYDLKLVGAYINIYGNVTRRMT